MRITHVRRISQIFFLVLLLLFAVVTTFGAKWWQLRGWPVNLLLQLDPLVALATAITTKTIFAGLLLALPVIVLTLLIGRFFCGWLCPFGTMHHFFGWLGRLGKPLAAKIEANKYRPLQTVKYYILIFLLSAALGMLISQALTAWRNNWPLAGAVALAALVAAVLLAAVRVVNSAKKAVVIVLAMTAVWTGLSLLPATNQFMTASLQTGLLDPIPLVYRSVNLALLPFVDSSIEAISPVPRYDTMAWLIGVIFLLAIGLNFFIPRFYCRFVCPLGALFGVLDRWAVFRIGRSKSSCKSCRLCHANCEGGCEPAEQIRISECVLCCNCLTDCRHDAIAFQRQKSDAGEISSPDISRRGVLLSIAAGVAAPAMVRLTGKVGPNWNASLVRPPGSLAEEDFLKRCIKCGQCMRVCPTNVLQPAAMEGGLEGLWTPILNNRIGSSGCQLNCVACGNICPTAAIRPLTLEEKRGEGKFAGKGPVKMGTAFVDRSRCLPWVADKPCIVCQENCPVSPKAIYVQSVCRTVRDGQRTVRSVYGKTIEFTVGGMKEAKYATGDYYLRISTDSGPLRISSNTMESVTVAESEKYTAPQPGSTVQIQVLLQQPLVDVEACIGCGICEHECPVSGLRAIRITAEGETRSAKRSLLV